ncbi:5' nucleotidase, NT5C type [Granulicella tundricola]|uniref:5'(3')-deoxyribonucleotidase n=1 Tax=Granulicella tundricola (strain ATCC BAA-1859 / DSM 23138 / MP5ACTX9) TaxID=1198114 RepID=E8WWT8_GRATM|nr:5'-3'-deoxyribonucleotidase [Granulicella tundricola]ADW67416.1 5'(3')-deoxyribonucleotidase [Granulicella tundricola MP5ACTX9]
MSDAPKKRICIDMDEVIADAVAEHVMRYNRDFNENVTLADLEGKWLWDVVQLDRHPALEAHLRSEDFFAVLNVMPDSQRVIKALQERYEVFIATAAMEVPTSFMAKYNWLARHFPFISPSHIVFCGDKSILQADYLIDDNPRQLRRFHGEGILFHSPHNMHTPGFRRVHNWQEVEDLFLKQQ